MSYGDGPYGGTTTTLVGNYRPGTYAATDAYVTIDGWTTPGIDEDGTVWLTNKVEGWAGNVEVRGSLADRPQAHGSFDGPNYYGTRTITVEGTACAVTRSLAMKAKDTLASIAAWDSTVLYPLVVVEPGRPVRRCLVRLSGPTKVGDLGGLSFDYSIQFVAPDPMRYDEAETVVPLSLPAGSLAGLTAPFTGPFAAEGVARTSASAPNIGTASTRPVVTLYGPLTNPGVLNATTGKTLLLTYELAAGDALVCDFEQRTVLLNGTSSRTYSVAQSAAWWELAPGSNDIVLTAQSGSGSAELRYRSAWH